MQEMKQHSEAGNVTRESLGIKEGEIYTFIFNEKLEERGKNQKVKRRMRMLKCYRHHAVFENNYGIRQSYRYWDIEKLLLRERR